MVKKYKRVDKASSIGSTYEANLVNRLNSYCELIGIDRTKLVSSLIAEALEGKILTNDFIELDKPYYFNYSNLIQKGTAEATPEKPVLKPEDLFILKKIPNNLDKPNKNYGTYSYDEDPNFHKGIYYSATVQMDISLDETVEKLSENTYRKVFSYDNAIIIDFYFLFEYEQDSNKITIHRLEENKVIYEIDPMIYNDALEDIKKQKENFIKNLRLPNGDVNVDSIFNFPKVMISYKLYKDTELGLINDEHSKFSHMKGFSEFNKFINK